MLRPYQMRGLKRDGARRRLRALSCSCVQNHVTQRLSRPRCAYRVCSLLWRITAFAQFRKISVSQWTGRALRAPWPGCCGTERHSWRRRRMAVRDRNTLRQSWITQSPAKVAVPAEPPSPPSLLCNAVAVSAVMAEVVGQIHAFAPAETVVFEG